jgi:hypothetical protein
MFAGIPVADYAAAPKWYQRVLGSPAFFPHETEAVQHAGHAMSTVFVDNLDAVVAQIADRGLEPAKRETCSNGVCKITYRDEDTRLRSEALHGNEQVQKKPVRSFPRHRLSQCREKLVQSGRDRKPGRVVREGRGRVRHGS